MSFRKCHFVNARFVNVGRFVNSACVSTGSILSVPMRFSGVLSLTVLFSMPNGEPLCLYFLFHSCKRVEMNGWLAWAQIPTRIHFNLVKH